MPGSTPGWPGWLATRHPLPEIQDNKAERTAETRAAGQMAEDTMTQIHYGPKSERLPLPSTLRGAGGHAGRPRACAFWGTLAVRSLREAVMSAQPLLAISTGTRGRSSQPPVPHEDLVQSRGAVPTPAEADR